MRQAIDDVTTFMRIGQPEAVATSLQPVAVVDESTRLRVEWAMNKCAAAAADLSREARIGTGGEQVAFRARLMLEELSEVLDGMLRGDHVMVADGLADLIYVTVGTAVTLGIPLVDVWDEVQRSNMAKYAACDACAEEVIERVTHACFGDRLPEVNRNYLRQVSALLHQAVSCLPYGEREAERVWQYIQQVESFNNFTVRDVKGLLCNYYQDVRNFDPAGNILVGLAGCPKCNGQGRVAIRDSQGKVQKPEGWTPPDIASVLSRSRDAS